MRIVKLLNNVKWIKWLIQKLEEFWFRYFCKLLSQVNKRDDEKNANP